MIGGTSAETACPPFCGLTQTSDKRSTKCGTIDKKTKLACTRLCSRWALCIDE